MKTKRSPEERIISACEKAQDWISKAEQIADKYGIEFDKMENPGCAMCDLASVICQMEDRLKGIEADV